MSRGIVLCHHGLDCSDWSVLIRLLLGRFIKRLLKLYSGDIFVVYIFNELLQLSCWLLSGLDRLN